MFMLRVLIVTILVVATLAAKQLTREQEDYIQNFCAKADPANTWYSRVCERPLTYDEAMSYFSATPSVTFRGKKVDIMPSAKMPNLRSQNVTIDPKDIITIGQKLWDIVKDNQPVLDYKSNWAGAVPSKYASDWMSMYGWQDSESDAFNFHWNILFDTVSSLDWKFQWNSQGRDPENTGRYVLNAGARLESVKAQVGQTVNAWVEAFNPLNYGTATELVAGVNIQVYFRSKSAFSDAIISCDMTVKGDGGSILHACAQHDGSAFRQH